MTNKNLNVPYDSKINQDWLTVVEQVQLATSVADWVLHLNKLLVMPKLERYIDTALGFAWVPNPKTCIGTITLSINPEASILYDEGPYLQPQFSVLRPDARPARVLFDYIAAERAAADVLLPVPDASGWLVMHRYQELLAGTSSFVPYVAVRRAILVV